MTVQVLLFFFYSLSFSIPLYPSWGSWSLSRLTSGARQGTPWTVCVSIAGQPFTHLWGSNLELPIDLIRMPLDRGRELEKAEETHTGMQSPHRERQHWSTEPRIFLLWSKLRRKNIFFFFYLPSKNVPTIQQYWINPDLNLDRLSQAVCVYMDMFLYLSREIRLRFECTCSIRYLH